MNPSPAARRLGVALLGIAFALPLSAQEWSGPAALEVRVEDAKGKSVQGAQVALEYLNVEGSVPPAPLPTDADGRCAIGGLAPGAWSLEVSKPGFMSYRAEILVALEGKPEIVAASQHNVPGAVSTMRVRLGRAKNAPLAKPAVVVVESTPAAAAGERPKATSSGEDEKLSVKDANPTAAPIAPVVAPAPAAPVPSPPAPMPKPAPMPVQVATPPAAPAVPMAPPAIAPSKPADAPTTTQSPTAAPAAAPVPPVSAPAVVGSLPPSTSAPAPRHEAAPSPTPATPPAAAAPAKSPVAPAPVPATPAPARVPSSSPPAPPTRPQSAPSSVASPPVVPALVPSAPLSPAPGAPQPPVAAPSTATPAAVAPAPVAPVPIAPVPALSPAPSVPPPAAPTPAPAIAAPIARSCFECRPGESALAVAASVAAGGEGCVADAGARLRSSASGGLDALRSTLGSGCALLRIDLPSGAHYTGFRYEAEGPNGRAADCLVGKECPAGGSRFIGEPIVRREGELTTVLGLFEASVDRRGTFTVYWSRTKR